MYPFTWILSSLKFPPLKFTRTLSKLTHSLFSRLCVQNCFCFFWGFFWVILKLLHLKYRIYLKIKNKNYSEGGAGSGWRRKTYVRCITYSHTYKQPLVEKKRIVQKKKKNFFLPHLLIGHYPSGRRGHILLISRIKNANWSPPTEGWGPPRHRFNNLLLFRRIISFNLRLCFRRDRILN